MAVLFLLFLRPYLQQKYSDRSIITPSTFPVTSTGHCHCQRQRQGERRVRRRKVYCRRRKLREFFLFGFLIYFSCVHNQPLASYFLSTFSASLAGAEVVGHGEGVQCRPKVFHCPAGDSTDPSTSAIHSITDADARPPEFSTPAPMIILTSP